MERFTVNATKESPLVVAVSQASPLRSMRFAGADLQLCDHHTHTGKCGQTSGGFMADTVVDKAVIPGSQQQWMTRNS